MCACGWARTYIEDVYVLWVYTLHLLPRAPRDAAKWTRNLAFPPHLNPLRARFPLFNKTSHSLQFHPLSLVPISSPPPQVSPSSIACYSSSIRQGLLLSLAPFALSFNVIYSVIPLFLPPAKETRRTHTTTREGFFDTKTARKREDRRPAVPVHSLGLSPCFPDARPRHGPARPDTLARQHRPTPPIDRINVFNRPTTI